MPRIEIILANVPLTLTCFTTTDLNFISQATQNQLTVFSRYVCL